MARSGVGVLAGVVGVTESAVKRSLCHFVYFSLAMFEILWNRNRNTQKVLKDDGECKKRNALVHVNKWIF